MEGRKHMSATSLARHRFPKRTYAQLGGLLPLVAVLVLAGCVSSPPATPAVLDMAHVRVLLGGAALPGGALFALGVVSTAATNGQPAVLVGGGTGSDGLLVPLTSGPVRPFPHGGGACQLALSVWQQGKLVACVSSSSLSVFAPDSSSRADRTMTVRQGWVGDSFVDVSWEPGGAFVDVLEQSVGPECFLDRFAIRAADPTGSSGPAPVLTARLLLPSAIKWCGSLAWAPTGTYLALRGFTSTATVPPPYPTPAPTSLPSPAHVFLVSGTSLLAQLSAALAPARGPYPTLSGLTATSVTLPSQGVPQAMAWEPRGDWLTVATGTRVTELNVASGERRDLFSVTSDTGTDICALAWTPDGTELAFIHYNPSG